MKPTKTDQRRPTNITLNPRIKAHAKAIADRRGIKLARFIEALIEQEILHPTPSALDMPVARTTARADAALQSMQSDAQAALDSARPPAPSRQPPAKQRRAKP
jgi:hypothetical protein